MSDEFEWMDRIQAEAVQAWLKRLCREHDDRTIAGMEQIIADEPAPPADGVVLYGAEGQVDYVWSVPEPLPHVLYAAVPPKLRFVAADEDLTPSFRKAEYRRIGERTYQRTA